MFRFLWFCVAVVIGPEGALIPTGSWRRCHDPAFVVSFSVSLSSVHLSIQAQSCRSFRIITAFLLPAFPHLTREPRVCDLLLIVHLYQSELWTTGNLYAYTAAFCVDD